MKAFPQLLSCLLVAAVALLNSGAAWSGTQPNKVEAGSTAKAMLQKAKNLHRTKKPRRKVKRVARVKAPASDARPVATLMNPYQPGSAAAVVAKSNPHLPAAIQATAPVLAKPIVLAAPVVAPLPVAARVVAAPASAIVVATPATPALVAAAPATTGVPAQAEKAARNAQPYINPYLANIVAFNQTAMAPFQTSQIPLPTGMIPFNTTVDLGQIFSDLKSFLPEPHLPSADISILPSIKKVYPTGEKPLYVLTFKCPTELIGITPLPTKALRWLITSGMEALNSTDLLPFNMQQVCQ